jgi:hypothetical protein
VLFVAFAIGSLLVTGCDSGATEAGPRRCNGHPQLCRRSLPEVALAATHNSMSAPLPGWRSFQQDAPIADQLADGIRGLLIDTHYGRRSGNRVRTDFASRAQMRLQSREDGVSPASVQAAERIRQSLLHAGGQREIYLCHSFCELGATPLAPVLEDLRAFVAAHPSEVLAVINQDYVTPADFVAAVRKAGLERFAYTVAAGERWPTLQEMIDSGHRVVFMAENDAGSAPWYGPVYDRAVQETPFSFHRASRLVGSADLAESCRPNRGPAGAPLFLLNHWVTTDPRPLPANAKIVNAYRPLMRRANECRRIRGLLPNLLAVDFYRRGDVFRVADRLNGIR